MVEMHNKKQHGTHLPAVRQALRELQEELKKIYLHKSPILLVYGSYARGQANPDSDIDVLLLYPTDIHPAEEIHKISSILADLNLRYQVLISILPASQQKYRESQEIFWKHVRREGVPGETI